VNYSHSKNIGEQVGDFCGTPILSYDGFGMDLDQALDVQQTVLRNQAMGCSDTPNTAEIMPGEMLCSDNMIRRATAAEVTGQGAHSAGTAYGSEKLAVLCDMYSIAGSTENKRGGKRQSTPEELCAWLNAMSKRSFTLSVKSEGGSKKIIATDKAGKVIYGFLYAGGTPGAYIGGEEARLLDRPQTYLASDSPSRVIQYFDNGNTIKHAPVEAKEYADEWRINSTYKWTPHVERLTVGGTALFDELKEEVELIKVCAEPEIALVQTQACEWYPDGETVCGKPITHAATKKLAGTCDTCHALREARA
jgi:hypothetical protein